MQSKWISIKDKLPEEHKRVLIWVEGHSMLVDSYKSNGTEHLMAFSDAWAWGYHKYVTHWMPLPSGPFNSDSEMEGGNEN